MFIPFFTAYSAASAMRSLSPSFSNSFACAKFSRFSASMLHHFARQLQQPHVIRNRRARQSNPLCNLLLRQCKLVAQNPERFRLLQRTQVFALQVLNNRHLRRLLVRHAPHQRRNVRLPRLLRSVQPPLT